jgi:hypothetical protein
MNYSNINNNLEIARPIYDNTFNFVDTDCGIIASYLFNEVNTTFLTANQGKNIINTYRTFNDVIIPIADFPVLKVYKLNEQDNYNIGQFTDVSINVSYILAYTQKQKVADVSGYVAAEIKRLLKNADLNNLFQINWDKPVATTYETMIDPNQLIYKYTNTVFNIYTCPITITSNYINANSFNTNID